MWLTTYQGWFQIHLNSSQLKLYTNIAIPMRNSLELEFGVLLIWLEIGFSQPWTTCTIVKYTIYTKVCGHPFILVDLAISAIPVAERCITSSTQPCNLHKQTLAVEWPSEELSFFQSGTVMGCHLSNKSVCKISALLQLPWSTVSAVIVKWKCLVATTAQPPWGKPHKLT